MVPMNPPVFQAVELRQYTLHPGRRDPLVELFEREFVAPQRALGIGLVGPFVDLDAPDRFVWWRGFADMAARAPALQAFYGGAVWAAWRDAANATMVDSNDVLLLRPLAGTPPIALARGQLLLVTVCLLPAGTDAAAHDLVADALAAASVDGATPLGLHATEPATNDFPRLPVREGENVLLWCTALPDLAACAKHERRRAAHPAWQRLLTRLDRPPQGLRLAPTPHAALHF
jgi:hypothetical protein